MLLLLNVRIQFHCVYLIIVSSERMILLNLGTI